MLFQLYAFDRAGAVKNDPSGRLRHDRGIELLQRTGCGIARIGERGRPCSARSAFNFSNPSLSMKTSPRTSRISGAFPFNRRGTERIVQDILGDVVAGGAITARRGVTQLAVFIQKRNGDAIDFRLDHHRNLFVRQKP